MIIKQMSNPILSIEELNKSDIKLQIMTLAGNLNLLGSDRRIKLPNKYPSHPVRPRDWIKIDFPHRTFVVRVYDIKTSNPQ